MSKEEKKELKQRLDGALYEKSKDDDVMLNRTARSLDALIPVPKPKPKPPPQPRPQPRPKPQQRPPPQQFSLTNELKLLNPPPVQPAQPAIRPRPPIGTAHLLGERGSPRNKQPRQIIDQVYYTYPNTFWDYMKWDNDNKKFVNFTCLRDKGNLKVEELIVDNISNIKITNVEEQPNLVIDKVVTVNLSNAQKEGLKKLKSGEDLSKLIVPDVIVFNNTSYYRVKYAEDGELKKCIEVVPKSIRSRNAELYPWLGKGGYGAVYMFSDTDGNSVVLKVEQIKNDSKDEYKKLENLTTYFGECETAPFNIYKKTVILNGEVINYVFTVMPRFYTNLHDFMGITRTLKDFNLTHPETPYSGFPYNKAIEFYNEILKQLRCLYSNGVAYTDIKSTNILVARKNGYDEVKNNEGNVIYLQKVAIHLGDLGSVVTDGNTGITTYPMPYTPLSTGVCISAKNIAYLVSLIFIEFYFRDLHETLNPLSHAEKKNKEKADDFKKSYIYRYVFVYRMLELRMERNQKYPLYLIYIKKVMFGFIGNAEGFAFKDDTKDMAEKYWIYFLKDVQKVYHAIKGKFVNEWKDCQLYHEQFEQSNIPYPETLDNPPIHDTTANREMKK